MRSMPFVLGALALASLPAFATTPDPNRSTVDHVIISSWNDTPAGNGLAPCSATPAGFDVTVRDFFGNPVAGAQVKIGFAGSGTAIRPYRLGGGQPIQIQCADRSINGTTDGTGHLNFTPHFGRYAETNVVEVFADGVLLARIEARSPDYDCDGDVDLADFANFADDYTDPAPGAYHARSDFDDCPARSLGDFAFFADNYVASVASGIPVDTCP